MKNNNIDLGVKDQPLLIFGGPVSNLQATTALFDCAHRLNILASEVICTGDLAAYCGQPAATIAAVQDSGCHVVMGNCEQSLAQNSGDCGCGFEQDSACDLLSAGWYQHASTTVTEQQRQWMSRLPSNLRFTMQGKRFLVVHGAPSSINRLFSAHESECL